MRASNFSRFSAAFLSNLWRVTTGVSNAPLTTLHSRPHCKDLTFQNPSAKMAFFFGMRVEDLQELLLECCCSERGWLHCGKLKQRKQADIGN